MSRHDVTISSCGAAAEARIPPHHPLTGTGGTAHPGQAKSAQAEQVPWSSGVSAQPAQAPLSGRLSHGSSTAPLSGRLSQGTGAQMPVNVLPKVPFSSAASVMSPEGALPVPPPSLGSLRARFSSAASFCPLIRGSSGLPGHSSPSPQTLSAASKESTQATRDTFPHNHLTFIPKPTVLMGRTSQPYPTHPGDITCTKCALEI